MKNKTISAKAKGFRKNIFKAIDEVISLIETDDVLFDKNLMKQIHDYKAHKEEKMIDWNKLKKTL